MLVSTCPASSSTTPEPWPLPLCEPDRDGDDAGLDLGGDGVPVDGAAVGLHDGPGAGAGRPGARGRGAAGGRVVGAHDRRGGAGGDDGGDDGRDRGVDDPTASATVAATGDGQRGGLRRAGLPAVRGGAGRGPRVARLLLRRAGPALGARLLAGVRAGGLRLPGLGAVVAEPGDRLGLVVRRAAALAGLVLLVVRCLRHVVPR
nr:hypothetical protein [Angustibacter aerolatus]